MKMSFIEACFFRNFPRWGVCLAMLCPCQGCPVLQAASQAGAIQAAAAVQGRSRDTSLIREKTAIHQPRCWHRKAGSPCNVSVLLFNPNFNPLQFQACKCGVRCGAAHERGEGPGRKSWIQRKQAFSFL